MLEARAGSLAVRGCSDSSDGWLTLKRKQKTVKQCVSRLTSLTREVMLMVAAVDVLVLAIYHLA